MEERRSSGDNETLEKEKKRKVETDMDEAPKKRRKNQSKLEQYFPKIVEGDTSGNDAGLNENGEKSDQHNVPGKNVDGETGDLNVDGEKSEMIPSVDGGTGNRYRMTADDMIADVNGGPSVRDSVKSKVDAGQVAGTECQKIR